eukprot:3939387-Amphidinium_carterae.1
MTEREDLPLTSLGFRSSAVWCKISNLFVHASSAVFIVGALEAKGGTKPLWSTGAAAERRGDHVRTITQTPCARVWKMT